MSEDRKSSLAKMETVLQRTIVRNESNFQKWLIANGHDELESDEQGRPPHRAVGDEPGTVQF